MNKMKKIAALILAAIMVFSLAACGSSGNKEDDTVKIGFALPSLNFPFYVRMYDTLVEECEARGWEYSFVDGNLDSATLVSGCQDLINQDIDVLLLATWWIDAMYDVFDQCESMGIPVFILDTLNIPDAMRNAVKCTTGTDNYNAGYVGGKWYAEQLKAEGKTEINMILVYKIAEITQKRGDGFVAGLEENGITVNVLQTYDAGERAIAMTCVEDALVAYSNMDLIYGASAQDSLGAYDACIGANRTEVIIMGFDGEDDEIALIDEGTQYFATITQDPIGMVRFMATQIEDFLAGKTVAPSTETSAGVYCRDGQINGKDIVA